MKKIKILLLTIFLSLSVFLLVACKSYSQVEFDRYLNLYQNDKKLNTGDKVLNGTELVVKPNFEELRKEKKTIDSILLNDEQKQLDSKKEFKFKLSKNTTLKSGDKRDVNLYTLNYDKTYFDVSPKNADDKYFENEEVVLKLKEQYPSLGKVAYFEIDGQRKNMVSSYKFIMDKDKEIKQFYIKLKKLQ